MISPKKLSDIAVIYNGNSINKTVKQEKYMNDVLGWNYIGTKDIDFDGTITYKTGVIIPFSETKFRTAPAGTVFVCSEGGSAGKKTALVKEEVCFGNKLFAIVNRNDEFTPKYIYYYTRYEAFLRQFKSMASTLMGGITVKNFGDIEIPVPPLPEQERIVARIEGLFSELDKAVETLKTTKQQLSVYRQAVLKEAFAGEYTSKWRKQHTDVSPMSDFNSIKLNSSAFKDTSGDENSINLNLPISWFQIRLGEIFEVEVGATPSRRIPEYWGGNINWVSSGEVHFNEINDTKECITENGLKNSSTNRQPTGTVMLAMIGEGKTRGQAAILNKPAAHNQNTAAILVSKTPCQPKYVYYFLKANYENIRRIGSGNNQKALNKERVRALRFPFTSFEEQKIIVREIEARLSVCDQIEKTIEQSLQQAEAMRQSILKQAFEGRFV